MPRRRATVIASFALLLAACSSASLQPSPSDPQPSGSDGTLGLPAGCQAIDLLDPDGNSFSLDGAWVEADRTDSEAMVWWIRAQGTCVWGVGTVPDSQSEYQGEGTVQNLRGTLNPDFTIDAEIAHLGPRANFNFSIGLAPVRILIEFSEGGGIALREDRDPGAVGGPRCPDQSYCIPPLVLVPE